MLGKEIPWRLGGEVGNEVESCTAASGGAGGVGTIVFASRRHHRGAFASDLESITE